MAARIQFQTVTTRKYTRVQWSEDHGQTWHEPEEAPVEVARAWTALQDRQARRMPRLGTEPQSGEPSTTDHCRRGVARAPRIAQRLGEKQ